MDLTRMVADSLVAADESRRQKQLADQLSRQVKQAIFDRAMAIADEMPDNDWITVAGIPSKVVAEWKDARGSHRIIYTILGEVKSITDTPGKPSKWPTSAWKLREVPLANVLGLFAPLMTPEYVHASR